MKKFSIWAILIVVLITSTLVKTDIQSSGKHNYKIIHRYCSKTVIGNKIKTMEVKNLQSDSPEITVRLVCHLSHNNKVQKIFLIDNRERKTKILLRKQRARSSIDKKQTYVLSYNQAIIFSKGVRIWKITKKKL